MKQKDVALIIVVAFVSAIISFVVSRFLFVTPQNRQQQVEVVQGLSASFSSPDSRYFNSNSIDPTQLTQIGNTNNPNPFTVNANGH